MRAEMHIKKSEEWMKKVNGKPFRKAYVLKHFEKIGRLRLNMIVRFPIGKVTTLPELLSPRW